MFWDQLLQWPPKSSTVIGLGLLVGLASYWVTGSMELAVAAAGIFKVLCPQDSGAVDQVLDMLNKAPLVMPAAVPPPPAI